MGLSTVRAVDFFKIQNGSRSACWETLNAISQQPFDLFWQNIAGDIPQPCGRFQRLRFPEFKHPWWPPAAILINEEITIPPQPLYWFWWNLARWCIWDPRRCRLLRFPEINNPRWSPTPSLKMEKCDISATVQQLRWDEIWHGDPPRPSRRCWPLRFPKFRNSKWPPAAILKNR